MRRARPQKTFPVGVGLLVCLYSWLGLVPFSPLGYRSGYAEPMAQAVGKVVEALNIIDEETEKLANAYHAMSELANHRHADPVNQDWHAVVRSFDEAAARMEEAPPVEDIDGARYRVSLDELVACNGQVVAHERMQGFQAELTATQQRVRGEKDALEARLRGIVAADDMITDAKKLYAQLMATPEYGQVVGWAWYDLDRSLQPSVRKLKSTMAKRIDTLGRQQKQVDLLVANYAGNVGRITQDFSSEVVTSHFSNGQISERFQQIKVKGEKVRHGLFESFHSNGQLDAKGQLDCGKKTGSWQWYSDKGVLKEDTWYVVGIKNGKSVRYWDNGKVYEEGAYQEGKRSWTWRSWSSKGMIDREESYLRGKREGPSTVYSHLKSGQPWQVGSYANGEQEGHWKIYHLDGGTLMEEGDFREGRKSGVWIGYWQNGQMSSRETYVNGKSVRDRQAWGPDGKLWSK